MIDFEDFPYKGIDDSFLNHQQLYNYIEDYVQHFNLEPHIQLHKNLENVEVLPKDRWRLTIRDLNSNKMTCEVKEYDVIIICVGNLTYPNIPNIKGQKKFLGTISHSVNYRKAEPYKNRKVLLIGSGPSGLHISRLISEVAEQVILSIRSPLHANSKFPENTRIKPGIKEIRKKSVLFKDGTEEFVMDILFCTGITRLKKVAIIGAGPAGLTALKICLDEGLITDLYDKSESIGGTFRFAEETGVDKFGVSIHPAVYEGFRTNTPKEIIDFEDFPYKGIDDSFLNHQQLYNYIEDYVQHFNLEPHIQLHKNLENVEVLPNDRWRLTIRDLNSNKMTCEVKEYDVIIICVGNLTYPNIPNIKGQKKFLGTISHSVNYRKAEPYKNRKVLLIGSGPSGLHISRLISEVAEQVILSIRSPLHANSKFPENTRIKPGIEEIREKSVLFKDGTEEFVTDILFCTGYIRKLHNFLSKSCEIEVEGNYTKYLYKQIINAKHPTMAFIAIPHITHFFRLCGFQMRFYLAFLKGKFQVPTEDMIKDAIDWRKQKDTQGIPYTRVEQDYYDELASIADTGTIVPVYEKMVVYLLGDGKDRFDQKFEIVNNEEFKIYT